MQPLNSATLITSECFLPSSSSSSPLLCRWVPPLPPPRLCAFHCSSSSALHLLFCSTPLLLIMYCHVNGIIITLRIYTSSSKLGLCPQWNAYQLWIFNLSLYFPLPLSFEHFSRLHQSYHPCTTGDNYRVREGHRGQRRGV